MSMLFNIDCGRFRNIDQRVVPDMGLTASGAGRMAVKKQCLPNVGIVQQPAKFVYFSR